MDPSSLRVSGVVLYILATACAIPFQAAQAQPSQDGLFGISNCGAMTADVSALVNNLPHILLPAIQDVSLPTSSDAYSTFFKDIASASYVHDILYNISTGAPLPSNAAGAPAASPVIFCLTGPGQVIEGSQERPGQDFYSKCLERNAFAMARVEKSAAHLIFICPRFWTQPAIPGMSSTRACLKVLPHFNRFAGDGGRFLSYRVWVLLHELAHQYIFETRGTEVDVYSVNECAGLDATAAVENAQNYAFYVANLWAGCTDFPRTRASGGGNELLEIDPNSTLYGENLMRGNVTLPVSGTRNNTGFGAEGVSIDGEQISGEGKMSARRTAM